MGCELVGSSMDLGVDGGGDDDVKGGESWFVKERFHPGARRGDAGLTLRGAKVV